MFGGIGAAAEAVDEGAALVEVQAGDVVGEDAVDVEVFAAGGVVAACSARIFARCSSSSA